MKIVVAGGRSKADFLIGSLLEKKHEVTVINDEEAYCRYLSEKYNIPHFDLDDIFWDNSSDRYGVKMPDEKRNQLLDDILRKNDWIIEGVFYDWLDGSFRDADVIILLDIPKRVYRFRIIRRFVKRKLGMERAKKETLSSLVALLKWTDKFQDKNFPRIYEKLGKYPDKTIILHSRREVNDYIK